MERFVQLIVAGGVVLVGALWLVAIFDPGSSLRMVGIALALIGTASVTAGIGSEIEL